MTPRDTSDATAFRLVTRVFLRRMVDNDLVSPHADRHESLAVLYAIVISVAVFATFFMSTDYLSEFVELPGVAALRALGDRFLFISASIAISALAALLSWDALALEPRDAAVLGPLPIPARTITRAKLAAVMVFAGALTISLNAVPSVLYPAFLTANIRGTRGATILRLMAAHATTVTMAGLFGFFGILAARGALRALLGERVFRRTSSWVQSALVLVMITGLLLAPTVRDTTVRGWIGRAATPYGLAPPVLWYLGLNETYAGRLVADTPIVVPARFALTPARRRAGQAARETYRALLSEFPALAHRGWLSFIVVSVLALATFLWTNRRLPDRSAPVPAPSQMGALVRQVAERGIRNDPEAQAGFFFTLQTLARSAPHRTIMTISVAVGLTHALIVVAHRGWQAVGLQSIPLSVLATSPMLLTMWLVGVRYAVRVPAEPTASWTIRMTWLGDERSYLAGVKRAAVVLATLLVVLLLPLNAAQLGVASALAHTLFDLLFALVVLDALFISYRQVPFACSYVPIQHPKIVWPAGLASALLVTYGFAAAERWALSTAPRSMVFGIVLGAIALLVQAIDRARRRERCFVSFDDRPAPATQRLGLFEYITEHD